MKFFSVVKREFVDFISEFTKKDLKIILAVALVISMVVASCNYLVETRNRCMTITLNYEEAKQGLNPDGSKFNIADIKSNEVLKNAIGILGDDSLTVDAVKKRVTIDQKMPISAIDQTRQAIASGSAYSYNPSEFDVYYSQSKKLGRNNTIKFIEALSEAYNEYFITKYSDKNVILEFDGADDFEDYDYYEIYTVLNNKINSMISYLGLHQEESTTFRSTQTGYSFENLISMLVNLRDKDLERLRAYIIQNRISKDAGEFIGKQQHLINKQLLNYNSNMQSSDIINSALAIYDPHITGIAFIPSVDDEQEYYMSRTKTGIDNLAMESYELGARANQQKKNIDERYYLINKFTGDVAAQDVYTTADKMIVDICVFLEKISTVSILTDDDYVSYKTNDYITFNLPKEKIYIPIIPFAISFVLSMGMLLAGYKLYNILKGINCKKNDYNTENAEDAMI